MGYLRPPLPAEPLTPNPDVESPPAPDVTQPPSKSYLRPPLPAEQTAEQAAPPKTWGQSASGWGDWLLGQGGAPVELKPRSLSQVGSDATNFGRVAGNQAFVPGALDVGLAALHGTDVAAENAKTTQAGTDIGPAASNIARFWGQRASVNRLLGEGGVPYANNPIAQGVVTGGGGTLLHGGNWVDAITNAAADTGLSYAGQAFGTGASALAKKVTDRSERAVSNAASGALEHLHDLQDVAGNVAGAAEQYAGTAKGAAKDAYQKIATAANRSIEANFPQRAAAAAVGNWIPGIGPLASAYIADPAIKAYNQFSRGHDIRSAIDLAYPAVAGAAKTAVDPDAWRSAFQNLAISQGPTGSGNLKRALNYAPNWAKTLWGGSQ